MLLRFGVKEGCLLSLIRIERDGEGGSSAKEEAKGGSDSDAKHPRIRANFFLFFFTMVIVSHACAIYVYIMPFFKNRDGYCIP